MCKHNTHLGGSGRGGIPNACCTVYATIGRVPPFRDTAPSYPIVPPVRFPVALQLQIFQFKIHWSTHDTGRAMTYVWGGRNHQPAICWYSSDLPRVPCLPLLVVVRLANSSTINGPKTAHDNPSHNAPQETAVRRPGNETLRRYVQAVRWTW